MEEGDVNNFPNFLALKWHLLQGKKGLLAHSTRGYHYLGGGRYEIITLVHVSGQCMCVSFCSSSG